MEIVKLMLKFWTVLLVCITVCYCVSHWPGTTVRHELYEHKDKDVEKESLNKTGCVELSYYFVPRCKSLDI